MGHVIEKGNYAPELDTIFPRFISEFLSYLELGGYSMGAIFYDAYIV